MVHQARWRVFRINGSNWHCITLLVCKPWLLLLKLYADSPRFASIAPHAALHTLETASTSRYTFAWFVLIVVYTEKK